MKPLRFIFCVLPLFVAAASRAETHAIDPLFRAISGSFRAADDQVAALQDELRRLPPPPTNQQSTQLGFETLRFGAAHASYTVWVEIDLGESQAFDAVVLVPVDAPYREYPGPGYGFPIRFRVDAREDTQERTISDRTEQDFPNPGGLPIWLAGDGKPARWIRLTMTKPWNKGDNAYVYAIGEIMVMRGNRNLAAGLPATAVHASDAFESQRVWSKANVIDGQSLLGPPAGREKSPTLGYHSAMANSAHETKWVQVDLGRDVSIGEIRLIGASVPQFPGRGGFGFPVRFKVECDREPDFRAPQLLADETARDFPNPGSNPVTILGRGATARYVRVTATTLWERAENFAFTLAELQVYSDGKNVALGRPVTALDSYPGSRAWRLENLTDGFASERLLVEWEPWLRGLSRRREALLELEQAERRLTEHRSRLAERAKIGALSLGLLGSFAFLLGLQRVRMHRRREAERLRQHIANDLHDEIGSNLGTIALLSEMALRQAEAVDRRDLEEIHRIARQTNDSMRDIIGLIQRPARSAPEFIERIRLIATRMLPGVKWTLSEEGCNTVPSLDAQRHLILALKEALHNVSKHAHARQVVIELRETRDVFTMTLRDDGTGFERSAITEGHGLASLQHRANALGGTLDIRSRLGQGTVLVFTAKLAVLRDK